MAFIPINKPILGEEEKARVLEVLESGKLTDGSYEGGKQVRDFEAKVSKLTGARHVVAVNSGTAALHAALMALGVKKGDEVAVPSFTFLATANVVLACGAKPVFVDTKPDYNMDPVFLRRVVTKKTRVIIPVHLYGYPADMDEIREIADRNSIHLVEDAAESLGAEYKGKQTGTLSEIGCFSLYATKVATSGEGGAMTTNSDEVADKLRLIRNHGMVHGYDSKHLGFNYRLPEIGAALASVQMDRLGSFLEAWRRNAKFLMGELGDIEGAQFTQNASDRTHVFYLYTLYLKKNRDAFQKRLADRGIGAAVYFHMPVHRTPLYEGLGYSTTKLRNTEAACRHVLSLPVHPGVTKADLMRISSEFRGAARDLLR